MAVRRHVFYFVWLVDFGLLVWAFFRSMRFKSVRRVLAFFTEIPVFLSAIKAA